MGSTLSLQALSCPFSLMSVLFGRGDHQQLPEQSQQWLALYSALNIFSIIVIKKKHLVSYALVVVHV